MTEQTQPTDAELLPCPFCGTQPDKCDIGQFVVECPSCAIVGPASDNSNAARRAWNTRCGTPAGVGPVLWPTTCDGKEQEAWETWAKSEHYDMAQHPLHYIFLNDRTFSARQGWRAGLLYAVEQMKAATPQPTQAQAVNQADRPFVVRLAEDFAEECVTAGYVTTKAASYGRLMDEALSTQAQAGAVPLTVQYPEGYGNPFAKIAYDAGWRAAEHAHGIKGADHG